MLSHLLLFQSALATESVPWAKSWAKPIWLGITTVVGQEMSSPLGATTCYCVNTCRLYPWSFYGVECCSGHALFQCYPTKIKIRKIISIPNISIYPYVKYQIPVSASISRLSESYSVFWVGALKSIISQSLYLSLYTDIDAAVVI